MTVPIARSYGRLDVLAGEMRVRFGVPTGDDGSARYGWVTGEQLIHDRTRVRALIDAEMEHARAELGLTPRRDVAATWVFQQYLWAVGALMSWPMVLDRRVPELGPADVALHMPFVRPVGAVVARTPFHCLPGDPSACDPHARVQRDVGALRAAVRENARAHLAPLLAALAPELRRGPWALWGTATDQLVSGVWQLGRLLGDEEWGAAEAQALLPGDTPPFAGGANVRHIDLGAGGSVPTRTRLSCCLLYTVAPEAVCNTCPRLRGDEQRLRRLAPSS